MKNETKTALVNRVKSLAWRAGWLVVVGLIAWLIEPDTVASLNLPVYVVTIAGLVLGEITKFLNTK